jgi:hypothetical protein
LLGAAFLRAPGSGHGKFLIIHYEPPEIGVFSSYIVVFDPEKNLIGSRSLPELIPFIPPYDIPPFGPIAQKGFHILNKKELLPTGILLVHSS